MKDNKTKKVKNLVVIIKEITEGVDEQGRFQTLACQDEQAKGYVFSVRDGWYNYQRYNEGDIITIKSARMFETSPSLSFLYYVRINHKTY